MLSRKQLTLAQLHLCAADARLAAVIEQVGACRLQQEPNAWCALASSIIGQQVSVHAARAIRGRFASLVSGEEFPQPREVLELSEETLRSAGLSRNKMLAIQDLARRFNENDIVPAALAKMDDETVIATLLPTRGIGRWTAEMFLIFSLGRPDVLAVDDLGLRNAIKKLYELEEIPSPARMREIAEPWRPWRSVASWYLWRSLDNEPKVT